MSEWSNELVSKTSVPHGTAGSNPVPSAKSSKGEKMKYCTHCGKQLLDEAVLCVGCGCDVRKVHGVASEQPKKFCNYCGTEVLKDAVVCTKCGCPLEVFSKGKVLQLASKILMVMSCIGILIGAIVMLTLSLVFANIANSCDIENLNYDFYRLVSRIMITIFLVLSLSLSWVIPMTVHYFKATKRNHSVGVAFKVCTTIFINFVIGILLFCDSNPKHEAIQKENDSKVVVQ